MFADGFDGFDALLRSATPARRVAGAFSKLFVRHPRLAWLADAFFRFAYWPLAGVRDAVRGR